MAKAKQDASALSKVVAGQMSKSEKRLECAKSIARFNKSAHDKIKAVKLAKILAQ